MGGGDVGGGEEGEEGLPAGVEEVVDCLEEDRGRGGERGVYFYEGGGFCGVGDEGLFD